MAAPLSFAAVAMGSSGQPLSDRPLSVPVRCLLVAAALGAGGLLAVCGWLLPEDRGYGTHQQLGLPPCTFVALFGRPCPTCGMTTSWAYLMHGQPAAAFRANPGGLLLASVTLLAVPWALAAAIGGRWYVWRPSGARVAWLLGLVMTVSVLQWIYRLWRA